MSLETVSWARSRYHNNAQHVVLATAWQRFWSRNLDLIFLSLLISFLSGVLKYHFPESFSAPANLNEVLASYFLMFTISVAFDAFCLAVFGQTFGRALAGIRVIKKTGNRLTFFEAFYRNVLVFIFGMFFIIPFLECISMLFAYFRVRDGVETIWDQSLDTYVVSESASLGSTFLTAVLSIFLLVTISIVDDGFEQSRIEAVVTNSDVAESGA
jgi:uncharacterized RDD family membrane protein YckC